MLVTTEDARQIDRLQGAIKAYQLASQRSLGFAMIKTGRNLAFALLAETRKITPSESELHQLPEKLGWRIKRSKGSALEEIARRIRHRFYQAAGWKPAIHGFVSDTTVTTFDRRLGAVRARVETATGVSHIQLINRAIAINASVRKYNILRKAVNRVFAGFAPYIKRKLGEDARKAFYKI
jgi:hypothetical protein